MYTPAPWSIDLETGEIVADGNGNFAVLGTVYGADDFPCNENDITEECKANARLIAAAPELLEALEAALQQLYKTDDCEAHPLALYEQIEGAIAKAKRG